MKDIKIEILLHKGMPDVRFGASTEMVMKNVGEPRETELLEEDDEFFTPTLIWHYPEDGLSFFFEGEEHMLTSIETDNQNCILFGQKLFGLSAKQIEELMIVNGYSDVEREKEAWGEDRISFIDALIDFYFEEGKLSTVDWGIIPE